MFIYIDFWYPFLNFLKTLTCSLCTIHKIYFKLLEMDVTYFKFDHFTDTWFGYYFNAMTILKETNLYLKKDIFNQKTTVINSKYILCLYLQS